MLFSFALILLAGMAAGWISGKAGLPPLLGMLVTGIVTGPYCLDLIDGSVLDISSSLRQIALVIILLRAGLNLKASDLKKNGRPALLMCFVPAVCEITGMVICGPLFFHLDLVESLVLGAVVAAVSPAVIVPHMLRIMEEGYGTHKGIPQMILAGASADDVFVIVLFTSFTEIASGGRFDSLSLLRIPTSIILGIAAGIAAGSLLVRFFRTYRFRRTRRLFIMLSTAFLLVSAEGLFTGPVGFSGLIGVMAAGMMYAAKDAEDAIKMSDGFSKFWIIAEVFLFVLVGAAVDIRYAAVNFTSAVSLVGCVLLFRMAGVLLCMTGTGFSWRERLFCMVSYTPKATVQAAIGAVPLAMGLACGQTVLTVAVTAILITAPLGAFMIDLLYRRCLSVESVFE
ncbi:MAG: cation:proton antiporter [Solobacterium sp.]|nr:cation:proton antiporter [Solobacterium sp.]